jgi:hypothetical protein
MPCPENKLPVKNATTQKIIPSVETIGTSQNGISINEEINRQTGTNRPMLINNPYNPRVCSFFFKSVRFTLDPFMI